MEYNREEGWDLARAGAGAGETGQFRGGAAGAQGRTRALQAKSRQRRRYEALTYELVLVYEALRYQDALADFKRSHGNDDGTLRGLERQAN